LNISRNFDKVEKSKFNTEGMFLLTAAESKKQIQYFDILRIAAVFFVILLHCINTFLNNAYYFNTRTWWLCNILNSFSRTGVPLFFMISGYFMLSNHKTLNFAEFYKKRFARILPPFLIWDIIYFAYSGFTIEKKGIADFFKELINNGSSYHFWFVYSLMGFYLLMPFIKRIVDGCSLKQLLWLLVIIVFPSTIRPFFNTVTSFYIFLFNPLLDGYIGYFILGYALGKFNIPKRIIALIYIGGVAGALICIIGNYLFSSYEQINLYFNGGYQINHFLLSSSIFVFAKHLKPIKSMKISCLITSISSITYSIYLCHVLVLDILSRYVKISRPVFSMCFNFFAASIICVLVAMLLKKCKNICSFFRGNKEEKNYVG